jgi:ParB-like chromosome segregation protein Spo0J
MSKSNGKPTRAVKSVSAEALKTSSLRAEFVPLASLKPHPRNYRIHPDDQLEHIIKSIQEHGFYRNVVAARDGTILAGHGVVQAALKMGLKGVPVVPARRGPG